MYITSFDIFSRVKYKLATIYVTSYFKHILTLQKLCKKAMFSEAGAGAGAEAGSGEKFSELEPSQNRTAPKPWFTLSSSTICIIFGLTGLDFLYEHRMNTFFD